MLTVISQEVNLFEALIAGVDPSIDLVPREAFRRPEETMRTTGGVLQQMDDSQTRAITVALEHLDYEMVPTDVSSPISSLTSQQRRCSRSGTPSTRSTGPRSVRSTDLADLLEGLEPGDVVDVGVTRDGSPQTLGGAARRDDAEGGAMIGITVGELSEPPFPLSIEAGDVGGPSAGMMHSLAIIDTPPGEMTKGHIVAGTGTIAYDATVAIGGIRQKVVGAEAAGAEYIRSQRTTTSQP